MIDIEERERRLTAYQQQRQSAVAIYDSARSAYLKAENALSAAEEAQKFVQALAQQIQAQVHKRIASVVTKCLEEVFLDDPYEFLIEFQQKRGRTEATLQLRRGKILLTDPLNEAGGGVIDVAAFALRLACLVLERPRKRLLLVLDEPFTKIRGKGNRQRMRGLVEMLSKEFGVQFIICIDHDAYPEFLLGDVVEIN